MPEDRERSRPKDIFPNLQRVVEELQRRVLKDEGRPSFGPPEPGEKKDIAVPEGIITFGRVVEFDPMNGIYRVLTQHAGEVFAVDAGMSALPLGAREYRTIPPGTGVLVFLGVNIATSVIIATVPDEDKPLIFAPNVIVHAAGGHSPQTDPTTKAFYNVSRLQEPVPTHIQGRPSDRMAAGEYGITTFTGTGFLVDPFLATLKVDEETGLYVFYIDRHTRLSGKSLELASSVFRALYQHREGFSAIEKGVALHTGEAIGILKEPPPATASVTAGPYTEDQVLAAFDPDYKPQKVDVDTVRNQPWLYMWEPPSGLDLLPYYRYYRFEGAIADGGYTEFIAAPSAVTAWDDVPLHIYRGMKEYPKNQALGFSSAGLEGFGIHTYRSGYYIGKEPRMPAPIRIRAEYDPDYLDKFQDLKEDTETTGLQSATALDEYIDATLSHKLRKFVDPKSEVWAMADPAEILDLVHAIEGIPIEYITGRVVRKAGKHYVRQNYYIETNDSRAFITTLPDGTKIISDGTGCEIRLQGGSIHISAPEDVYITAGKNIFMAAGSNMDVLTQGSIQLVSSIEHIKLNAAGIVHIMGEGKCLPCDNVTATDPSCTAAEDCLCASGCDQFPCAGGVKIESPQSIVMDSRDISFIGRSYIYAHCIDVRNLTALDIWAREGHYCHLSSATLCSDVGTISAYLNVCSLHVTGSASKASGSPLWSIGGLFKTWGESPIDCSANAGAIARKLLAKKLASAPCNFLVERAKFTYVVPEPRWHYLASKFESSAPTACTGFDCADFSACDDQGKYCPRLPLWVFPNIGSTACAPTGSGEIKFEYARYRLPALVETSDGYDWAETLCDYLKATASAASGHDLTLGYTLDQKIAEKVHPRPTVHLTCKIDPNCK